MAPQLFTLGGNKRELVLAFDVGTTFSGVSYCVKDPGRPPVCRDVQRFKGDTEASRDSKVPSVIYYDRNGKPAAIGAYTLDPSFINQAITEGWTRCEWFKLHMRPNPENTLEISRAIPDLPTNPPKTVVDAFADMFTYLFESAKEYIVNSVDGIGASLWSSFADNITFIISHPNRWGGFQHTQLRNAALLAGLVPDTPEGRRRISFVTEGEASLHFALSGLPDQAFEAGNGVAIVDAGGGTIDISIYTAERTQGDTRPRKATFREVGQPVCHIAGAVLVSTNHAKQFLKSYLADSPYNSDNDIDLIVGAFDRNTKKHFASSDGYKYIQFGTARDNDTDHNIRNGLLKLQGSVIASFFEPAVSNIIASIQAQWDQTRGFRYVILVGGFSGNNYLLSRIKSELEPEFEIIRPTGSSGLVSMAAISTGKAVSRGAVEHHISRQVSGIISQLTYGRKGSVDFDPQNREHVARRRQHFYAISGTKRVDGTFNPILRMDTAVDTKDHRRERFYWEFRDRDSLRNARAYFWVTKKTIAGAYSFLNDRHYGELCTIEVDLYHLYGTSSVQQLSSTRDGKKYYRIFYHVVIFFGEPELKVHLVWKERGKERWSEAKIIYQDELNLPDDDGDSDTEDMLRYPPPPREGERDYDDVLSMTSADGSSGDQGTLAESTRGKGFLGMTLSVNPVMRRFRGRGDNTHPNGLESRVASMYA